jgi:hypothetical protein
METTRKDQTAILLSNVSTQSLPGDLPPPRVYNHRIHQPIYNNQPPTRMTVGTRPVTRTHDTNETTNNRDPQAHKCSSDAARDPRHTNCKNMSQCKSSGAIKTSSCWLNGVLPQTRFGRRYFLIRTNKSWTTPE